jgi:hypothetical protein
MQPEYVILEVPLQHLIQHLLTPEQWLQYDSCNSNHSRRRRTG